MLTPHSIQDDARVAVETGKRLPKRHPRSSTDFALSSGVDGVYALSVARLLSSVLNWTSDVVIGTSSYLREHSHGKDSKSFLEDRFHLK